MVLLTPFNNKTESSRDYLTNLIMSFITSFDIISVVVPNRKILLCIAASAADTADNAAVNPKGIKTLLANGLIKFFINGNKLLVMDQEVYQEILLIVSS